MSTQTSLSEIQTALYSKLTGDATLMALATNVYDFTAVPDDAAFPYVTIGDAMETPNNAFGRRGYVTRQLIHIWDSSYGGLLKAQGILARLNFLIDQKPLALATQSFVYLLFQQAHTLNDPGANKVIHIIGEYETFSQE